MPYRDRVDKNRNARDWNSSEIGRLSRSKAHLKHRYGLSVEEYKRIAARQNWLCAICEERKPLCVDHDHETNKIRGLLCRTCNSAIGLLGDRGDGVHSALNYLVNNGGYFATEWI